MTDGSRQLADIADDLEAVKAEMDERGSSMTDGTPLVNIRKSLARMKQEVVTMDVRVGVVQHTLLQAKLYIPNTTNIWKKVLTKTIWADKKWAGFWQISLYIK